jgi:hypothetical protein
VNKLMVAATFGAVLVCASPVAAFEKDATTPSGRAEMMFAYTTAPDALTAVQSTCMDLGWMVTSQSANQVVCEVPMGMMQSAFTQLLIGNSYSTTPRQFARFSMVQVGDHTRVQTQVWAETQMAFGQMQQHQYTDDGTYNNMLNFLGQAGAQFPLGTTFTARPYLGINGVDATWQNGRRAQYGHRLQTVVERAPGYQWGMRSGDILIKVNNRTFRDNAGLDNLLNRQRIGQPMTLTVLRDGAEVEVSGLAQGRPQITSYVRPQDVPEGSTAVALQVTVAALGDVDSALATMAPTPPAASPPAETDIERMRREAAEAQARLAAAEAAAAQPSATEAPEAAPTDPAESPRR